MRTPLDEDRFIGSTSQLAIKAMASDLLCTVIHCLFFNIIIRAVSAKSSDCALGPENTSHGWQSGVLISEENTI